MPVIVFASPKGGVGKSTSALLLAQVLASEGASVSMIDADPNQPLGTWAKHADKPENLTIIPDVTEKTIIERIDEESERVPFVVVDLEGSMNLTASRAIGRASLVIIPMQASHLDAQNGIKTIRLIRTEEQSFRRSIPHCVLFTKTHPATITQDHRAARDELVSGGVPVLGTSLTERSAFKAIFAYNSMIGELPDNISNIPKAVKNAEDFAAEVVAHLKEAVRTA